jgi:hypothetical protein
VRDEAPLLQKLVGWAYSPTVILFLAESVGGYARPTQLISRILGRIGSSEKLKIFFP